MKRSRLRRFLTSATARLAGTYLLIIMVMSLGFSLVFYHTSFSELGRQLPPNSFFMSQNVNLAQTAPTGTVSQPDRTTTVTPQPIDKFLEQRISEGRRDLMERLITLNSIALVLGSVLSYILARRSLQPIEAAMEAQTQFVSDASHELRTPLTAIQTSNEVFLRRPKMTIGQAKQLIEQNTNDVKRLKDLANGLLTLSQHGSSSATILKPVHMQDIVSQALPLVVQQATEKAITLHDELQDSVVLADRVTLTQAMIILLDNAVKYCNDEGNIYLTSAVRNKYAYIHVRDDGIGIRASDLPHVFRRFYRADNARMSVGERSGYGLGLSIAKQIIDNHHGTISVHSTPGEGATFTLKLPLA